MITNRTFSFWPPIPAQNNRDLAKDTRYVDLRAFNMLHGLKPFHVTCVLLTSNVPTFGHCPVGSLGFADREPSADSSRKRIDADKLYRQNVVRSPASTWTSTTLEITRGLPRRAMVENHSTVSHWHTAGLGSQVLNRTQYASHKVSVSECLCEKCATHVLICSFHCVWRRIGQMTRRSTPERSRARVKSDSSQRCRRRSQDRRESRELGNTQWVTWCADGVISERHTESLKHLEPMHVHWMKCETQREKCARACVRWGVICTAHRRVHDIR